MPRTLDYPRAPLSKALELAHAVDALGGSCTEDSCAARLGRATGGAFSAVVSAAARFGLIARRKGQLTTTELFREIKHAYTEEDERQQLADAFLTVPIFEELVNRFTGKTVPIDILDKLLAKELGVPDAKASVVARYFLDGARRTGVMDGDGRIESGDQPEQAYVPEPAPQRDDGLVFSGADPKGYVVHLSGPGLDSRIQIAEADDLLIVEALLKKVKRSLGTEGESSDQN